METVEENIIKEIRELNRTDKKRKSKFDKKSGSFKDIYNESNVVKKQPYKRNNFKNFQDYLEDDED